jgi:mannan endo-1,4-beta-mannosidase
MPGNIANAILFLGVATTVACSLEFMPRQDSRSFAGSNEYFLHALPVAQQKTYVETLAGWGVKVLRLWG